MKNNCRHRGIAMPILLCFIMAIFLAPCGKAEEYVSYTNVGEKIPSFSVKTLDGEVFDVDAMKGKVVFLNFWATWCAPCHAEMPVLEKAIWQQFKNSGFAMIAIAREQTAQVIAEYLQKNKFSFPMAPDPKRAIYAKFAQAGIPRNYVINSEGIIIYQSFGYSPKDFAKMKSIIEKELKK